MEVEICDAAALDLDEKEVVSFIQKARPDVIAITITTLTVQYAREVSRAVKALNPEVLIVFGGPHVSALPFENLDVADLCVVGEGEETFSDIIKCFLEKKSFEKIKGIAYKNMGGTFINEPRPLIKDLDKLPVPARDLLPPYTFTHVYPYRLDNPYYDNIITSRGCAYDCSFCASKVVWNGKVRFRSMDNIFMEIDELVNKHKRALLFIKDDNFLLNKDRVSEFCQIKKKSFPKLKWICHARVESFSLDLLKEMESSGCLELQVGVESGDDGVLQECKKMLSTEVARKAFELLKKTKINSWATFIIGNEGDSVKTVNRTIEFAKKLSPTYSTFLFLLPLPGSRCFERMSNKKYIKTYDWSLYSWHGEPVFETELLSKKSLKDLRKKAYRDFYLRPSKIMEYLVMVVKEGQLKVVFRNILLLIKFMLGLIK